MFIYVQLGSIMVLLCYNSNIFISPKFVKKVFCAYAVINGPGMIQLSALNRA